VCGLFGLLVVPLSNPEATLTAQLFGAAVIFAWVFTASLAVWAILKATIGIRVTEEEEMQGMDIHDCGVDAYPEFVTLK
jgi:Amt family ammonium transporter